MTKQEFEKLAGYEVEFDTYKNIIEPMYMATDIDKYEFVKMLDKKYFAVPTFKEIEKKLKKELNKGDWNKIIDLCEELKQKGNFISYTFDHSCEIGYSVVFLSQFYDEFKINGIR